MVNTGSIIPKKRILWKKGKVKQNLRTMELYFNTYWSQAHKQHNHLQTLCGLFQNFLKSVSHGKSESYYFLIEIHSLSYHFHLPVEKIS